MDQFSSAASLFSAIALLLLAAHAVGKLFESLRLPRVIGEIIGGLLLGPTLLSHVAAAAMDIVFSSTGWNRAVLPVLSQVGLILLMFSSGTQLRSFVERGERKVVAVLAVIGIVIPFLAGLLAEQFIDIANLLGPANQNTAFLLVFATAIAIASIPVISRIMIDLGIMNTSFARIVISTAVIDDLVLYVVLAVALGLVKSPTEIQTGLPAILALDPASLWAPAYHVLATIFLMLFILIGGLIFLRFTMSRRLRLFSWDNGAVTQILTLAVVAITSKFLDLNPMFGALATGMVVGRVTAQTERKLAASLQFIGKYVLVPIYFALVGYRLDLIHHFDLKFFVGFLAFACAVKAVSIYAGARIAGKPHGLALNLAAALNARGGPGIVLASVAFDTQIINENFFAVLVLTAIATSLLAGWWLGNMAPDADGVRWRIGQAGKLARPTPD
jgi:Kef-type K+ transport system membrane component KefB